MTPGEYRVVFTRRSIGSVASGLPAGFYAKEVRFGGIDVLDRTIQVADPEVSTLSVVISPNTAAVAGTIRNQLSETVSGATVVLVPNRNRDRVELFRQTTTDSNGRFSLRDIPPGEYRAFA